MSVVLASVVELFFLLRNSSVNFLLDLSKFKLCSKDLVLLSLKSTLSLFKSSLELLLLSLKSTALFVKFMDGASTITKLIKKILDLISKVLVLTTNNIKLLSGFIKGSLKAESLSIEVTALRVASIQLSHKVISLGLPFSNNLVKVATTLLSDHGGSMSSLILHGELLKFIVHPGLGLLSGGNLGVEGFNDLLGLLDTGSKLGLATLKLINAAKSLNLILGFPELNLSLSLGESLESIILLLIFFINSHAEVLSLSHQVLVLGEQGGSVPSLSISKSLGVLKLSGQRDLVLLECCNSILTFLNLSVQVLGLNNKSLGHFATLLHVGPISHGLLKSTPGLLKISLHTSLVFFRFGLVFVDGVNLLSQLGHAVVVLLSKSGKSTLMGNV